MTGSRRKKRSCGDLISEIMMDFRRYISLFMFVRVKEMMQKLGNLCPKERVLLDGKECNFGANGYFNGSFFLLIYKQCVKEGINL